MTPIVSQPHLTRALFAPLCCLPNLPSFVLTQGNTGGPLCGLSGVRVCHHAASVGGDAPPPSPPSGHPGPSCTASDHTASNCDSAPSQCSRRWLGTCQLSPTSSSLVVVPSMKFQWVSIGNAMFKKQNLKPRPTCCLTLRGCQCCRCGASGPWQDGLPLLEAKHRGRPVARGDARVQLAGWVALHIGRFRPVRADSDTSIRRHMGRHQFVNLPVKEVLVASLAPRFGGSP